MKVVFHTNSLSPHQMPLARELVKLLGADEYRYIYTTPMSDERAKMGWNVKGEEWVVAECDAPDMCLKLLEDCEVLISGLRELDLFERRMKRGLKTFYCSERWFKPLSVGIGCCRCWMPGRCRMVLPSYRKMAKRFVRLVNGSSSLHIFPYGVWAMRDFECMGIVPEKMTMIGYCVEPSSERRPRTNYASRRRVLWVGRMIDWKRVDTIVRAAKLCPNIDFTLIGRGPLKKKLMSMASGVNNVKLLDAIPIEEIRGYMREHDIYVLASNAEEGWGAVLNEALEEGMRVVGTYEAGSSATMLTKSCLFHAGDHRRLAELLQGDIPRVEIERWTVKNVATRLVEMLGK